MNGFKITLILCWFLSVMVFSGAQSASASSIDSADIENFMDKAIQAKMKEGKIIKKSVRARLLTL